MLSSVTWSEYLIVLMITTLCYYALVAILFFRSRMPSFSRIGGMPSFPFQAEDAPDEIMTTAQHVIEELRPILRPGAAKNELLFALRQQLAAYTGWEEPGFRETVNRFLLDQIRRTCSIRLDNEEVSTLWK